MKSAKLKDAAVAFMRQVGAGKIREAYDTHVAKGMRHHNPYFRGDRESLMAAMQENAEKHPEMKLEIKHAVADGDLVALHCHVKHKPGEPGVGLVHIFRFEGDRVAELWDLGQPVPQDSPNENGMF